MVGRAPVADGRTRRALGTCGLPRDWKRAVARRTGRHSAHDSAIRTSFGHSAHDSAAPEWRAQRPVAPGVALLVLCCPFKIANLGFRPKLVVRELGLVAPNLVAPSRATPAPRPQSHSKPPSRPRRTLSPPSGAGHDMHPRGGSARHWPTEAPRADARRLRRGPPVQGNVSCMIGTSPRTAARQHELGGGAEV